MTEFELDGVTYVVDSAAENDTRPFRLPDGRIVVIDGWTEGIPSQPCIVKILPAPRPAVKVA